MKQTPQEQKIRERMAALSQDGFMGSDVRGLNEVIDEDRSALERMGLTTEQMADALEDVLRLAMPNFGRQVELNHLRATYEEAMGRIPCPWGGHGLYAKGQVELVDTRTGRRVWFTPLSIHLIRAHGFFEGRGSRYRLEPAQLAQMLGLVEG